MPGEGPREISEAFYMQYGEKDKNTQEIKNTAEERGYKQPCFNKKLVFQDVPVLQCEHEP